MNDDAKNKVEKYIGPEDSILASYRDKYFATQKRLIVLKKDGFEDYMYSHISSITYKRTSTKYWIIGAILLLFMSTLFTGTGRLLFLMSGFFAIIGWILGFFFGKNFYIIRTTGGETFKIEGSTKPSETEEFIKIIREHSG